MDFTQIIQKVNSNKKLIPDLLKSEKGNNFRAVSESAILEVIDPVLNENCIFYTIGVKEQHLDIREAFGSKGKKLQFIATITVSIRFWMGETEDRKKYLNEGFICETEAVGMGIDDNDKAMGKAYTYAVKYALLKIFRLRYGDDSDFKASEPLHTEKPKDESKKEDSKKKKSQKQNSEIPMSEKQRDYILGMMDDKGITSQQIMSKFDGYDPKEDEFIPMKVARAIIKFLEETEDLPF